MLGMVISPMLVFNCCCASPQRALSPRALRAAGTPQSLTPHTSAHIARYDVVPQVIESEAQQVPSCHAPTAPQASGITASHQHTKAYTASSSNALSHHSSVSEQDDSKLCLKRVCECEKTTLPPISLVASPPHVNAFAVVAVALPVQLFSLATLEISDPPSEVDTGPYLRTRFLPSIPGRAPPVN